MLEQHSKGLVGPCNNDSFPGLGIGPDFSNCAGVFMNENSSISLDLTEAKGKKLYEMMVKCQIA